MRLLKASLGLATVAGWAAFAFSPRARVPAGPPALAAHTAELATLHATVLYESEELALPTQVAMAGGHLVVVDRYAARPVRLIDPASGEEVMAIGREGEGPGEFRVARSIDPVPGGDAFWVFDAALSRLTYIDPHDWVRRPAWERRILRLESSATVTNPVWVDGNRLLAAGFFTGGRLGRFDGMGRSGGAVGALPAAAEGVPATVLQEAYQGVLRPHPDRSRFAVGTRHAGFVEFYTATGELAARAAGPFPFEPRFEVRKGARGPSMASGGSLRFGYVDLAPAQDRVYALFSGRTRAGFGSRAAHGDQVHVFDWTGEYHGILRLDTEVIAITVDEARDRLIAVRHLPSPALISFPLRDLRG